MFKTLLKARHARKESKNDFPQMQQDASGGANRPNVSWSGSVIPVEYDTSPPSTTPRASASTSSCGPAIEYNMSPPVSMSTSTPIERSTPRISHPGVEYPMSAPAQPSNLRPYIPPPMQATPTRTSPVNEVRKHYGSYLYELPAATPPQHAPVIPELPATPVLPRHELPVTPTLPRPHLQSPGGNSWSTLSSTVSTTSNRDSGYGSPATSPPTSPNPTMSPPPSYRSSISSSRSLQPGTVSKYQVRIYCQRKSTTPNPIREIPRDIREFRTAKLALIPVAAGPRHYVSIDIVFGEIDKNISGLLEKHFIITSATSISSLNSGSISEDSRVREISHLQVAYEGKETCIYVVFATNEEDVRFKEEFYSIIGLVEN